MKLCFVVFSAVVFSAVVFSLFFPSASAFATDTAEIHLSAQMWKKESTDSTDYTYYAIGEKGLINVSLDLSATPQVLLSKKVFQNGDLTATVSFIRVNPTTGTTYVSTQTRLTHTTKGLISECSRYDSPTATDIGVGSCSGAVDGKQFGISFLKD